MNGDVPTTVANIVWVALVLGWFVFLGYIANCIVADVVCEFLPARLQLALYRIRHRFVDLGGQRQIAPHAVFVGTITQLAGCPFCASGQAYVADEGCPDHGPWVAVRCRACGAQGPVRPDAAQARAAWNHWPYDPAVPETKELGSSCP